MKKKLIVMGSLVLMSVMVISLVSANWFTDIFSNTPRPTPKGVSFSPAEFTLNDLTEGVKVKVGWNYWYTWADKDVSAQDIVSGLANNSYSYLYEYNPKTGKTAYWYNKLFFAKSVDGFDKFTKGNQYAIYMRMPAMWKYVEVTTCGGVEALECSTVEDFNSCQLAYVNGESSGDINAKCLQAFKYKTNLSASKVSNLINCVSFYKKGELSSSEMKDCENKVLGIVVSNFHSADYNHDWKIDGTEFNRIASYWRAGSYYCNSEGYDGYAAGNGSHNCAYNSADYNHDWKIENSEYLRVKTYFEDSDGYYINSEGYDGFAVCSSCQGVCQDGACVAQTSSGGGSSGGGGSSSSAVTYQGVLEMLNSCIINSITSLKIDKIGTTCNDECKKDGRVCISAFREDSRFDTDRVTVVSIPENCNSPMATPNQYNIEVRAFSCLCCSAP